MKHTLAFGGFSQRGAWPLQEDSFWVEPSRGVFVLCDAFGGFSAGDSAAAEIAPAIGEYLVNQTGLLNEGNDSPELASEQKYSHLSPEEIEVMRAFTRMNKIICERNFEQNPAKRAGASVVAGKILSGGRVVIGAVGVIRVNLFKQGKLEPLLMPHSGLIGQRIGASSKDSGDFRGLDFPTRFLGLRELIEPDLRTYRCARDSLLLFTTEGINEGGNELLQQVALLLAREGSESRLKLEVLARESAELAEAQGAFQRNGSLLIVAP